MKKIINRKLYDTEKAEQIHYWSNDLPSTDFQSVEEVLYKTKKGVYFIAGSGGPKSSYAEHQGDNQTSGNSDITLLTIEEAIDWLQDNDGEKAIIKHFSDRIVDA